MELITKLDRGLAKLEEILLALLLVSMVVLAAVQVLLRNIWNTSIDWADISLQNATLLLGLLGAAIATSEGRHLNIDIFSRLLRGRGRTALKVLIGAFSLVVCALLVKGGITTYQLTYEQWASNLPSGWTAGQLLAQQVRDGSIPQWLTQLMLPIGFGVIGFHFALRLVRDLYTLASGREWEPRLQVGKEGDALLDQLAAQAAVEAPGDRAAGKDPPGEEGPR